MLRPRYLLVYASQTLGFVSQILCISVCPRQVLNLSLAVIVKELKAATLGAKRSPSSFLLAEKKLQSAIATLPIFVENFM